MSRRWLSGRQYAKDRNFLSQVGRYQTEQKRKEEQEKKREKEALFCATPFCDGKAEFYFPMKGQDDFICESCLDSIHRGVFR